jgi:hypothetical protein
MADRYLILVAGNQAREISVAGVTFGSGYGTSSS